MRIPLLLIILITQLACTDLPSTSVSVPSAEFEIHQITQNQVLLTPLKNYSIDEYSFVWDFGDDSQTSHLANPIHTYTQSSEFEISLTIVHIDGLASTHFETITINNEAPIASFTTRYEPMTLILNANSSQDEAQLSYVWDIAGDELTGESINYISSQIGDIEVTLTVTDLFGEVSTQNKTLTISNETNLEPKAIIFAAQNNHLAKFIASNSYDLDKDHLTYRWILDGEVISTEDQFYYTFEHSGEQNLTLEVFDGQSIIEAQQSFTVVDTQRNDFDILLYQVSEEIAGKCTSCHDDGSFYITNKSDLAILESDLKDYINSVSAQALIGFPSETQGFNHSGLRFIAGQDRLVEAGDQITEQQLPLWTELILMLEADLNN